MTDEVIERGDDTAGDAGRRSECECMRAPARARARARARADDAAGDGERVEEVEDAEVVLRGLRAAQRGRRDGVAEACAAGESAGRERGVPDEDEEAYVDVSIAAGT